MGNIYKYKLSQPYTTPRQSSKLLLYMFVANPNPFTQLTAEPGAPGGSLSQSLWISRQSRVRGFSTGGDEHPHLRRGLIKKQNTSSILWGVVVPFPSLPWLLVVSSSALLHRLTWTLVRARLLCTRHTHSLSLSSVVVVSYRYGYYDKPCSYIIILIFLSLPLVLQGSIFSLFFWTANYIKECNTEIYPEVLPQGRTW